jgi:hypothetical protein
VFGSLQGLLSDPFVLIVEHVDDDQLELLRLDVFSEENEDLHAELSHFAELVLQDV